MSGEPNPSFWKRWRLWLSVLAAAWFVLIIYMMLPAIGVGSGVTEANGRRIVPGMPRAEVEAILGTPNPLPDLASKGEAFWDAHELLGFRYAKVHVTFDAGGQVAGTKVEGFWISPRWKFW